MWKYDVTNILEIDYYSLTWLEEAFHWFDVEYFFNARFNLIIGSDTLNSKQ